MVCLAIAKLETESERVRLQICLNISVALCNVLTSTSSISVCYTERLLSTVLYCSLSEITVYGALTVINID